MSKVKLGDMTYADRKNIPYAVLCGSKEIEEGTYTLRNMKTGDQESVDLDKLIEILK